MERAIGSKINLIEDEHYYAVDFMACVEELWEMEEVQRLAEFCQHCNTSRLQHSLNVSYYSYRLAKLLGFDYKSAARAGLLHDLFWYDWMTEKQEELHAFYHPKAALKNAREITELNKIEVKTSVSELTKRDASREFSLTSKPAFLSKSGLTPTERGTALHKFMQYANFEKAKLDPQSEVDRLYEFQFISKAEADVIDTERVKSFTNTDLFERILNSNAVYREQRFLLDVKAGDIYPELSDLAKEQTVIVQGAVDCMFEEGDHIVIIDFKTDRTTNEEFLLNHYAEQLKTYSVAAEKMFGKPVSECYIYSLYMNKKIRVK
ncbi:MAG: PD-(D/E)XK nuclease family protein [Clostridia bacterium]|nr:PD-(D/E)XK nuclease family protein [Clostridia bacterium]